MIKLARDVQLELVHQANRAPSAHNSQPARWRFLPDGCVRLYEDRTRRITVGDPNGRDARIGLGAAFEGMHLGLTLRGLGLSDPEPPLPQCDQVPGLTPVAEAVLRRVDRSDPLAKVVGRRRTHRGIFVPADETSMARLNSVLGAGPDVISIREADAIADIARLHDGCAMEFLSRPEYQAELYSWIRFSRRDAGWLRDGLTAECLGLSAAERLVARHLFHPRMFHTLGILGLGKLLTSEAKSVRSAAMIAILHADPNQGDLASGRRFYRFLLELCRAGFAACPMSALVDSKRGRSWLRRRWGIPQPHKLISVLRIGKAATGTERRSPRLPAEELLV